MELARARQKIAQVLPYIFVSGIGLGLIVTAALGRPDLAARGSYLLIPAILAAVVAIPRSSQVRDNLISNPAPLQLSCRSFSYLALIFGILYSVSLYLLISYEARPLSYFCLVAAMVGLILVEILSIEQTHSGRKIIVLIEMTLLSLGLTLGQTLKLPLYFGGGGDILFHMHYTSTIVESGYITAAMEGYRYFPLFHILVASGTILTGLDPQVAYFLFSGLSFSISIPLIYLIVSQVTKDVHLPLVAALIYSQSQVFLFGGMYTGPREICFVVFLLTLYLLIRARTRQCFGIMAIALIPTLVFMHQITLAYISGVLLVFFIMEFVLHRDYNFTGYIYLTVLTVAYLSYWYYIGAISSAVAVLSSSIITPLPGVGLPSTPGVGLPSTESHLTCLLGLIWIPTKLSQEPAIVSALRYADFSVLAFIVILGVISHLYKGGKESTSITFALLALVAFPLCFPGPLTLFPTLFLVGRISILLSPFIVFAAAEGALVFVRRGMSIRRLKSVMGFGFGMLLIPLFSFTTMTILANETDINIGRLVGVHSRNYFSDAELDSFSFAAKHTGELEVYSDYHTWRYFSAMYTNKPAVPSMDILAPNVIREGYFLFRKEEFQSRGQLIFLTGDRIGFGGDAYTYRTDDASGLETLLQEQEKIFENGDVQIYYFRE